MLEETLSNHVAGHEAWYSADSCIEENSVLARLNLSSLIFWPFLIMVLLSPVPFGSIYPWSLSLISAITGILLLGWIIHAATSSSQPAIGLNRAWVLLPAPVLVALWIVLQIAPWMPDSLHHPLWQSTGAVLNQKLDGRITLDAHESATGLMRYLTYCGVFWIALQYGRDADNARRMMVSFAVAGAVYAVYGLIAELSGSNTILWYEKEWYKGAVTSVFRYKNAYATYAALTLICVIALFLEGIWKRGDSHSSRAELRRRIFTWLAEEGWLPGIAIVAIGSALALSNSRAGIISGGIGVLVLLITVNFSHMRRAPYLRGLAAVSFLLTTVFFFVGGGTVMDRLASQDVSGDIRVQIYEATSKAIADAPLTGTGSGTFDEAFFFYHPMELRTQVLRAHSTYLENAMELGIPAAIILTLAILIPALFCLAGLIRRRRHGIYPLIGFAASAVVGFHALFDFTMQVPAVAVTYFAMLGVGCAQSWGTEDRPRQSGG